MVTVTVLGAAGGIGQPLSLLLKSSPYVSKLKLYDIRNTHGVGADISHINTNSKPESYEGEANIGKALTGSDIVIIPAGIPRKPGMTRDDLFKANGNIMKGIAHSISDYCPNARILVISNPVNSTVPIMAEVLKKAGKFNPKRLFGITTLDLVRAQTFLLDLVGREKYLVESLAKDITVIGGHSGKTIVPVFTNKKWLHWLKNENKYDSYINRVQFGGDEVVKAKDGAGSATLSMAVAGYHFAELIIKSIHGEEAKILEPTFLYLPGVSGGNELQKHLSEFNAEEPVTFFAAPVKLKYGEIQSIESNFFSELSEEEKALVKAAIPELIASIKKGVQLVSDEKARPAKL